MPNLRRPAATSRAAAAVTDGAYPSLTIGRHLGVEPGRVCAALAELSWLGLPVAPPDDRPDLRRVETDLAFNLLAQQRAVTFRKAALVDIGLLSSGSGGCAAEVAWRAASLAPLFPVFAGRLVARAERLELTGVYAPPGGQMGLAIDRVLLHHVAERTAEWFLDRLLTELSRPVRG